MALFAPERPGEDAPPSIEPGTAVEVRNRFCEEWSPGFVVEGVTTTGFRVRRERDGALIPLDLAPEDVRAPVPSNGEGHFL